MLMYVLHGFFISASLFSRPQAGLAAVVGEDNVLNVSKQQHLDDIHRMSTRLLWNKICYGSLLVQANIATYRKNTGDERTYRPQQVSGQSSLCVYIQ